MIKYLIGAPLGGLFGYFILYRVIGCATGTCAITANPYTATIYGLVIGLVIASMFGSGRVKNQAAPGRIGPEEAMAIIRDTDNSVILDVRSKEEYASGHLPGSLLLPVQSLKSQASHLLPDPAAQVLVYCRAGRRSARAVKILGQLGYQNVHDFGAINNWPGELVTADD